MAEYFKATYLLYMQVISLLYWIANWCMRNIKMVYNNVISEGYGP